MRREHTAFYMLTFIFVLLFSCPAWAETKEHNFDLSEISRRVEDNDSSERDLAKLTDLAGKEPGNANVHYLLGRYLENKGFEQLALDSYAKAIDCDPNFKLAHYMRCLILVRTGDVELGVKEVFLCEKFYKDDGDKLFRLGQSLQQVGKRADAQRLFRESTLAGRKERGYGLMLARIKFQQKKFDEALEAVDWDLKLDGKDWRANMFKSEILLGMKRNDEAAHCLVQAAKHGPCGQDVASSAANQLIALKRYNDALTAALFELLCQQNGDAAIERSKSKILDLIGRLGVKESLKVISSISPDIQKLRGCRYFRLALGDIYDRLNRPVLAMGEYQMAIHDCPVRLMDDAILARVLFRLGLDYESAFRNHREALNLYRRARMLAPDDREIAANHTRLEHRMKTRRNDVSAHLKDAWYSFWTTVWQPLPSN